MVNRGDCVCIGKGVDGVTIAAGYNVPEFVEPENATAKAGDRGRMKFWVEKEESSRLSSSRTSDDAFSTSPSFPSVAQLNPRPIEVTPQLFPALTARLKEEGKPQLSSSKVISTAAGAVSIWYGKCALGD